MTPTLLAAKLALGPILLPQARWLRRTAVRLPEAAGLRAGVAGEGEPVVRILVVGDSSAAGVGVAQQSQALAWPMADALSAQLGGAVGWQLVARTGVNTSDARDLARGEEIGPADVIVTALGVNDVSSQTSPRRFVEELEAMWVELRGRTSARWLVVCGLPPMHMLSAIPHPLRWYLGLYSTALDRAALHWSREQGFGYCGLRWASDPSLLADDGFHPGPKLYPLWAQQLADLVASHRDRWETR